MDSRFFFLFTTLLLIGPRFAFTISCFPSAMVAHIARDSLPLGVDASLLHLNDLSCGVNYVTKNSVIIKAVEQFGGKNKLTD